MATKKPSKYVMDRDLGMRKIMAEFHSADRTVITVGVQKGEVNEDGTSVAEYAAHNEYGTDKIPQRSFIGTAFDENKPSYIRYMHRATRKFEIESFARAVYLLGLNAQQDIQSVISKRNILPRLADSTIKAKKGSTKTLVDTGALVNSITFEVKKI